jgi:heme iron utilization protein
VPGMARINPQRRFSRRQVAKHPASTLDAAPTAPLNYAMIRAEQHRDAARLGRCLMRGCERAALATSYRGAPYVSLVLVAADLDASPLLLLSDLAQHSRNLAFDPRVSLLLDGTEGHADRLDGPRLSLLGRAEIASEPRLLARFTARHPSSAVYAGFTDFRIYRIVVERGHLVAGFGRIEWIEGGELRLSAGSAALAGAEPAVLAELNQARAAAIDVCAQKLVGRAETGWQATGIDPDGIDLRCAGAAARLDFPAPALTADLFRAAFDKLVQKA